MEWIAYISDCTAEVEKVLKGCRMSLSFAVHLKTSARLAYRAIR
jgi:hypothetical protein